MGGEALLTFLSNAIPYANIPLSNEKLGEKIRELIGDGIAISAEQIMLLVERVRDKLGNRFEGDLDSSLRLGQALGHDLTQFAKKQPLLIFFDTYEEIDEGDKLLQICMGAAGKRVGWVISGRDNLWAGLEHRKRSMIPEYGYKEIALPRLSMEVDFSADGVGVFTLSDIEAYFSELCLKAHKLWAQDDDTSKRNAARIEEATLGVPLAVKIVAGLYFAHHDLTEITEGIDGKREIVDQMVERYLRLTGPFDRARIYGLALLRRVEDPAITAAALNITDNLEAELRRLHRLYSFIFTRHDKPALHQEVRHFLRLWLRDPHHRTTPEIMQIIEDLRKALYTFFSQQERQHEYASLHKRLEEAGWVELYLDRAELEFWRDPGTGVKTLLPFMFAAGIYRREANREARKLGNFFRGTIIENSHQRWWEWAEQSLGYRSSRNPLPEEVLALKEMVKLASLIPVAFAAPIPAYKEELEAAIWWRLAEAYQGKSIDDAIYYYKKALERLPEEKELQQAYKDALQEKDHPQPGVAPVPIEANKLYTIEELNRILQMNPHNVEAHQQLGGAYQTLGMFQGALKIFDDALELDPASAKTYVGRGDVFLALNKPDDALRDFDRAFELDPKDTSIYEKRGEAYLRIGQPQRALDDFKQALQIDPNNAKLQKKRQEAESKMKIFRTRGSGTTNHTLSRRKTLRTAITIAAGATVAAVGGSFFLQSALQPSLHLLYRYTSHTQAVEAVAWSPDGSRIASGGWDKTVQVWKPASGQLLYTYKGHADAIWSVVWSPDHQFIASASADKTVQVWRAVSGTPLVCKYTGHTSELRRISWSPDGTQIVSSSLDGTIQVWQATTGKKMAIFPSNKEKLGGTQDAAWSPNGLYIASANYDGTVDVWDANRGTRVYTYQGHTRFDVDTVAWSPNSTYIASASSEQVVRVWEALTGKQRFKLIGYSGSVWDASWSPDGKYIATGSKDGSIRIWDASTGHNIITYRGDSFIDTVTWAPDSKRLAAGATDMTVSVWSM
jgi:WD40 repeat protein/predicted negative regulator of RcsB-dependent stress response